MKTKFLLLFIILNFSFAQNKFDLNQFTTEGGEYFTAPLEWKAKDLLFFGLTAGITFGAIQLDDDIKLYIQAGRADKSSIPIIAARMYGEPILPVLLSSYFIINGNSSGNKFQKKLGFEIAQATFYSVATTQLLKVIFGRERPTSTDDNTRFTGFNFIDNKFWSIPSGHTTLAFALSTVLSENSSSEFLKIISYLPALFTAYSRVYENRHWFSDVVLGGIIGFTTAKYFVNKHESKADFISNQPSELFSVTIPLN